MKPIFNRYRMQGAVCTTISSDSHARLSAPPDSLWCDAAAEERESPFSVYNF